MIIAGIDPGSRRIGYGLIKKEGGLTSFVDAGLFPIQSKNDAGALVETKKYIDGLIAKKKPDVLAIEKLYLVRNETTGIQTAQARGVILLSAGEHGLRIEEFTPNEVKAGITGYGLADKAAVAKMVRLTLKTPGLDLVDDAMDALAIALMAAGRLSKSGAGGKLDRV